MTDFSSVKEKNGKDVLMFLFAFSTSRHVSQILKSVASSLSCLLKLPLSPGLRFRDIFEPVLELCIIQDGR